MTQSQFVKYRFKATVSRNHIAWQFGLQIWAYVGSTTVGLLPFTACRRGNRKDMVIATKVRWFMSGMVPNPKQPNAHGLSRKHILDSVEGSLKRLQTDYIDLYQVLQKSKSFTH